VTLRQSLDDDVCRVHQLVDRILDREDGVLVLFDGARVVSFAAGLGMSPCQLELVIADLERLVRGTVSGAPQR